MMFAHVAGVPVEETAFSLGPVAFVITAMATARLREHVLRHRARKYRPVECDASVRGRQ